MGTKFPSPPCHNVNLPQTGIRIHNNRIGVRVRPRKDLRLSLPDSIVSEQETCTIFRKQLLPLAEIVSKKESHIRSFGIVAIALTQKRHYLPQSELATVTPKSTVPHGQHDVFMGTVRTVNSLPVNPHNRENIVSPFGCTCLMNGVLFATAVAIKTARVDGNKACIASGTFARDFQRVSCSNSYRSGRSDKRQYG